MDLVLLLFFPPLFPFPFSFWCFWEFPLFNYLHSNHYLGICFWVKLILDVRLLPAPALPHSKTKHRPSLSASDEFHFDGWTSVLLMFLNQLALFYSHPSPHPIPSWPQSHSHFHGENNVKAAHCGLCTVFHWSKSLWELTHAVDIKQHLAGLMWGNSKSNMSSLIIQTILPPCISCGFPAKVSDLLWSFYSFLISGSFVLYLKGLWRYSLVKKFGNAGRVLDVEMNSILELSKCSTVSQPKSMVS